MRRCRGRSRRGEIDGRAPALPTVVAAAICTGGAPAAGASGDGRARRRRRRVSAAGAVDRRRGGGGVAGRTGACASAVTARRLTGAGARGIRCRGGAPLRSRLGLADASASCAYECRATGRRLGRVGCSLGRLGFVARRCGRLALAVATRDAASSAVPRRWTARSRQLSSPGALAVATWPAVGSAPARHRGWRAAPAVSRG